MRERCSLGIFRILDGTLEFEVMFYITSKKQFIDNKKLSSVQYIITSISFVGGSEADLKFGVFSRIFLWN